MTFLVAPNDSGIRPAGPPDACFYCQSKVGEPHQSDCVIIVKTVRMKYIFEVEVVVPHAWDAAMCEFHRGESSWCADNAIDELEATREKAGCLCWCFTSKFIADASGPRLRGDNE